MSKSATASSRVKERKAETLLAAVAALQRGDVIVFPTETLYGLGADALDSAAVDKVFRLKDRDSVNPIPVLVSDQAMLRILVAEVPALAQRLIERFWPGPLTLVLPARAEVPQPLLNSTGGVGVRISSQPIASGARQIPRPSAHRDQRESIRPRFGAYRRGSKKLFCRPGRDLCRRRRAHFENRLLRRRSYRRYGPHPTRR